MLLRKIAIDKIINERPVPSKYHGGREGFGIMEGEKEEEERIDSSLIFFYEEWRGRWDRLAGRKRVCCPGTVCYLFWNMKKSDKLGNELEAVKTGYSGGKRLRAQYRGKRTRNGEV